MHGFVALSVAAALRRVPPASLVALIALVAFYIWHRVRGLKRTPQA